MSAGSLGAENTGLGYASVFGGGSARAQRTALKRHLRGSGQCPWEGIAKYVKRYRSVTGKSLTEAISLKRIDQVETDFRKL